jgi:hypothetical protein
MNLTHLKPGDKIATANNTGWRSQSPAIAYELLTITRVTDSQVIAENQYFQQSRFRRVDGKKVGDSYVFAVEATPYLLDEHAKQVAEVARWSAASKATDDLMGKHLHQLKLNTAQLERLAAAWAEVKAMGSAA